MVEVKKVKLNLELEVDMPLDILEDQTRHSSVKDGIVKSMIKGLYEQGLDFKITGSKFNIEEKED